MSTIQLSSIFKVHPARLAIMDILISIAKWLALSAGAAILFGALLVGLLAWLLNRPVD